MKPRRMLLQFTTLWCTARTRIRRCGGRRLVGRLQWQRGLGEEAERFRGTVDPSVDSLRGGHAIESIVHLDGRQRRRVVLEHASVGKTLRVEHTLPGLVGVTAGSGKNSRHAVG